jgi:hypothetical protein
MLSRHPTSDGPDVPSTPSKTLADIVFKPAQRESSNEDIDNILHLFSVVLRSNDEIPKT